MPSMASMILRTCREAARAAHSAGSAASRCAAAAAARSASASAGGVGVEASNCLIVRSRRRRPPIAASPAARSMRSHTSGAGNGTGSGSSVVIPPPFDMVDEPLPLPAKCRAEFVAEEKDLESDEALWALYERWCKYFNEERDRDEMARRFSKFKETVLRVQRNKKAGLPYTLEINYLADGKLIELYRPKVPIWEYVRRMPYSDSVIYGRPPDFLFSEGHKFLSKKK